MADYPLLPPGLPGQVMQCLVIDANRVVINPSLNQMESFVIDPTLTEDPKRVEADYRVREAYEMRKRVQRLLSSNKAKRDNVPAYKRYLEAGIIKGQDYVTPPQSLVFTSPLNVYVASNEPGATTFLQIPPGAKGTHDDGETQYLARLALRNEYPETGNLPFAVVVDHSRSVEWGAQAFHDLNLLGVAMSAAVAIAADGRDPATALAKLMASSIPALDGKVSFDARQVSSKNTAVMTITTLRRATAASLMGKKVFALGNKPYPDEVSEEDKHDIPLLWREILTRLEPHLNHNTVLGLPAVMTAIGIALHEARSRGEGIEALLRSLEGVQWDKSTDQGARRWAGIAGKLTEDRNGKTKFSAVGGVKDLGYRVVEALTDSNSTEYIQIRARG